MYGLSVFIALLITGLAAITDMRSGNISKNITITGLLASIVFILLKITSGASVWMLGKGTIGVLLIMLFWLFGAIGGGDAKLLMALALLMGPVSMFIVLAAGSLLTIIKTTIEGDVNLLIPSTNTYGTASIRFAPCLYLGCVAVTGIKALTGIGWM